MPSAEPPSLTFDEVDDLLYFTRVNEAEDLQQTISELAQKYNASAKEIISAAVDPESKNTLLHFCSANGFPDLLKSLLVQLGAAFGPDGSVTNSEEITPIINKVNTEGNTPLHWAALNGHLEIVKTLIAAGADMWVKNSAGHLAMFEAERAEKNEVVHFMLEAGGSNVETAGDEKQEDASAEDVVVMQAGEQSEANGSQQQNGGAEAKWGEAGPSG